MSKDDIDIVSHPELARLEPSGIVQAGPDKNDLLMQTLTEAQVDFLLQRTPKQEIKMRQGRGGMHFAYVEHGYVTERLNLVFGFNWDFDIFDKQMLEDEVIVEARLTVRTPGGQTIVKTQFGGAEIKRHASGPRSGRPLSIADDYKAAGSDALKKCASLLGIGLDLYGRDRPDEVEMPPEKPQAQRRERPRVVDSAPAIRQLDVSNGLCTTRQVEEITRAALQAGRTVEELCDSLGVLDLSELTEARAQRVIARLHTLARDPRHSEAS